MPSVKRLLDHPIITPKIHPSIGRNLRSIVNSTTRLGDEPTGQLLLYFADHKGSYILLAYANELTGPWLIYEPGGLHLSNSLFPTEPPVAPRTQQQILN